MNRTISHYKLACTHKMAALGLLALALLAPVAGSAAPTLDELMQAIREQSVAENNANREREARFQSDADEQERRYQQALSQRNAAEALSTQLSTRYDNNEIRIEEMEVLLELHQGNLGELFGVTRQIAGDASGVLGSSLITAQLQPAPGEEGRIEFLRRVAAANELPSILELERLWMELLNEMTEDAKVVRFTAPVVSADGVSEEVREVVRIASFTAISDGQYLAYLPGEQKLAVMGRQPVQGEFADAARRLQAATPGNGYVSAVVDPARGALLDLFVLRPDLFERIAEGEVVGYLIIGVGALGVLVALFQYGYLFLAKLGVRAQERHLERPQANNPLGRVLLAADTNNGSEVYQLPEILELRLSEARLREVMKLERFQSFLRLAVSAGPLLGLIGTVIGMIITFESITASGSSDPKLMAQGIGQAMIATVLGLGVAIPLLFINTGLAALSRSVIHTLEEQGTQLMANRLQRSLDASHGAVG